MIAYLFLRRWNYPHDAGTRPPEDVHTVSRNASTTKPAKFLVFFVKQKGAPITVPAK